ncbi:hypothetical protein MRX96_004364 [Rhipicephalus microplus]
MYQRLTTIQYDFIQDLWSRNNIVGCGRRLLVRCLFVDYANKPDRRIRSWHRAHVQIKADNLDLDNIYLLRGLGVEVLDAVEMSRQEAARNILRLAMYEASRKKSVADMDAHNVVPYSTDVWKLNTIQKYEDRYRIGGIYTLPNSSLRTQAPRKLIAERYHA